MLKYIHMPDGLSFEQAWALLEFIWQLEELVQDTYEEHLREICGPHGSDPPPNNPRTDDDLDDDIPF
jgi:hypothetical protein